MHIYVHVYYVEHCDWFIGAYMFTNVIHCVMYWTFSQCEFCDMNIFICLINEVYVQHSCACSRELKVITETCMLLFYYRILLDKCLIAIKCICTLFKKNCPLFVIRIFTWCIYDVVLHVWIFRSTSVGTIFSDVVLCSIGHIFSSTHL